jgi:hypothetical protein
MTPPLADVVSAPADAPPNTSPQKAAVATRTAATNRLIRVSFQQSFVSDASEMRRASVID